MKSKSARLLVLLLAQYVSMLSSFSFLDVFEKGLLQNHGLLPEDIPLLEAEDAASNAANMEIPHLACGPLEDLHAMRAKVSHTSQHDTHTAQLSKATGTGCFLAFMRPQSRGALTSPGWTIQAIPNLLKIHPSVLSYVQSSDAGTLPLLGESDPNRPHARGRHGKKQKKRQGGRVGRSKKHSSGKHSKHDDDFEDGNDELSQSPSEPATPGDPPANTHATADLSQILGPIEHEISIEFVRSFLQANPDRLMKEALKRIIADLPREAVAILRSPGGVKGLEKSKGELKESSGRVWADILHKHVFGGSVTRLGKDSLSAPSAATATTSAVAAAAAAAKCAASLPLPSYFTHSITIPSVTTAMSTPCLVAFIQAASQHPAILRITLSPKPTLTNYEARGVIQGGKMDSEPYREAGLDGSGQICGVADSGVNDLSCFFVDDSRAYPTVTTNRSGIVEPLRRKIIQYVSHADDLDEEGGHGTHVCGTIAGEPLGSQEFFKMSGMAPAAKIAFFDIGMTHRDYLKLPAVSDIFDAGYKAGARVHTNSWGNLGGLYGQMSYDVDQYSYEHPDMLIIFAAGNSGDLGPKSIISPGNAKNTLSVGAAQTRTPLEDDARLYEKGNTALAYFSSLGPTFDGRMKPDIVAPGDFIQSAYSGNPDILRAAVDAGAAWNGHESCGTHQMSGTSMAAPAAAGTALLIRQFFMDPAFWASTCDKSQLWCKRGSFAPSGPLVKAVFLHSGRAINRYSDPLADSFFTMLESFELPGPPDNFQGYGQIYLPNVLPLRPLRGLGEVRHGLREDLQLVVFDELVLSEHETLTVDVEIDESGIMPNGPIKVTITWYDPPSTVGSAASLLLHDLDLAVHAPNGDLFLGNAGATAYRLPSQSSADAAGDTGSSNPTGDGESNNINATLDASFLDQHTDAINPNEQVLILYPKCVKIKRSTASSASPSAVPSPATTSEPSATATPAPSSDPTAADTSTPTADPTLSATQPPSTSDSQPLPLLGAKATASHPHPDYVCTYRIYIHANTLTEAPTQLFAMVITAPKTAKISAPIKAVNWIRAEKVQVTFAPTPAFTIASSTFQTALAGSYYDKFAVSIPFCTTLARVDVTLSFARLDEPLAWPENMELTIATPSGDAVAIGGADTSLGLARKITEWPDTWISTIDGQYTATINVAAAALAGQGEWELYVMNSWSASGKVQYNATVSLDFAHYDTYSADGSFISSLGTCAPTPVPSPFSTEVPSMAPTIKAKVLDPFLHMHKISFSDVALGVSEPDEITSTSTDTNSNSNANANANANNAETMHLHSDFSAVNNHVLLESFNFTGSLEKIALSIDASVDHVDTRGSNSWLFTVTVTDSRGLLVQVGGFEWVAQRDRFYIRRWPDAWVGRDSFGRRWVSVRDVHAAGLEGCHGSSSTAKKQGGGRVTAAADSAGSLRGTQSSPSKQNQGQSQGQGHFSPVPPSSYAPYAPLSCPLPVRSAIHRGTDIWFVDPSTDMDYWVPALTQSKEMNSKPRHSPPTPAPTLFPTDSFTDPALDGKRFVDPAYYRSSGNPAANGNANANANTGNANTGNGNTNGNSLSGQRVPQRRDDWTVKVMMGYPFGYRLPTNFSGAVYLAFRATTKDEAKAWDASKIFGSDSWDGSSSLWEPSFDSSADNSGNDSGNAPAASPTSGAPANADTDTDTGTDADGSGGADKDGKKDGDKHDADTPADTPDKDNDKGSDTPDNANDHTDNDHTDNDHKGKDKHKDEDKDQDQDEDEDNQHLTPTHVPTRQPRKVDKISHVDELMRHAIIGRIFVILIVTWVVIIAVLCVFSDLFVGLTGPLARQVGAYYRFSVRYLFPASWWGSLGMGEDGESLLGREREARGAGVSGAAGMTGVAGMAQSSSGGAAGGKRGSSLSPSFSGSPSATAGTGVGAGSGGRVYGSINA